MPGAAEETFQVEEIGQLFDGQSSELILLVGQDENRRRNLFVRNRRSEVDETNEFDSGLGDSDSVGRIDDENQSVVFF